MRPVDLLRASRRALPATALGLWLCATASAQQGTPVAAAGADILPLPSLPGEAALGPPILPLPSIPERPAPEVTPAVTSVAGRPAASFSNALDIGRLLEKSDAGLGIQTQFRSAIIADPRVRGYHVGQVTTYADGGYLVPARVDLDTIVSKLDPTAVRDILVI